MTGRSLYDFTRQFTKACRIIIDGDKDEELSELRAENERRKWQPIETAPKDGTAILIAIKGMGVHRVEWTESVSGIEIWCVDDNKHGPFSLRGYMIEDLLGWQPLPAPPDGEATETPASNQP